MTSVYQILFSTVDENDVYRFISHSSSSRVTYICDIFRVRCYDICTVQGTKNEAFYANYSMDFYK